MAKQMSLDERLAALADYEPAKHIVQVKTKQGMKDYYPACWRLYELNLRYPNANFSTELVWFDLEHDFCIVKCRLYLGASYEQSDKKAEAMKSGKLTELDKIETAAKARAARDFGISTETALDVDPDDEVEQPRATTPPQPKQAAQGNGQSNHQASEKTGVWRGSEQPGTQDDAKASPQQLQSIEKLAERLGRQVQAPASFAECKIVIASLSAELNARRQKAS